MIVARQAGARNSTVKQLGVGLIGCGGMGRSLAKQLVTIESARLVGVTDVNPEAAAGAAQEFGTQAIQSTEELLAQDGLDAVVIASPGFQHRPLTELAAASGKHVFVEKPMATNVPDCDAMAAAAERAGITLMVGQVLRYYPTWWKILELVRAGEIGTPWAVTLTRISGGWGGWAQPWRNSLELSGGLLMEVNAHEIDFMCQLCGDVERVYAEADKYGEDAADYPNLYFVSLRFKNGAVGMLHSSSVSAVSDLSGKVQGSEGSLVYTNGFGSGGEIRYARIGEEAKVLPINEIEVEPPVRKELRLFVEAVQKGEPAPIPASEGRRNVQIAMAAYESARTGQAVKL